ncbi:hypothetical protein AHF37_11333 [Paragonimus kellicotti]|nr:hypothetical protein AHF37_11333 [Paragonimus kellicotti]
MVLLDFCNAGRLDGVAFEVLCKYERHGGRGGFGVEVEDDSNEGALDNISIMLFSVSPPGRTIVILALSAPLSPCSHFVFYLLLTICPSSSFESSSTSTPKPPRPPCLSYLHNTSKATPSSRPALQKSKSTISKVISSNELSSKLPINLDCTGSAASGFRNKSKNSAMQKADVLPNALPCELKQTSQVVSKGRRCTVGQAPSSEFHNELRLRHQRQSQTQSDAPNSAEKCSKTPEPLASTKEKSDSVLSSGYFTMPRLRPSKKPQVVSAVSEPRSNVLDSHIPPSPTRPAAPPKNIPLSEHLTPSESAAPHTVQWNSLVGGQDKNSKRLSWTGPAIHRFNDIPPPGQRACLPTILSTSSTALDSIVEGEHISVPSKQSLTVQLTDLLASLKRLKLMAPTPAGFSSEMEQLISIADQLEACRLNCSVFIDQADCSARAKFSFRDRYAPMQQLSSSLRAKKSSDERAEPGSNRNRNCFGYDRGVGETGGFRGRGPRPHCGSGVGLRFINVGGSFFRRSPRCRKFSVRRFPIESKCCTHTVRTPVYQQNPQAFHNLLLFSFSAHHSSFPLCVYGPNYLDITHIVRVAFASFEN